MNMEKFQKIYQAHIEELGIFLYSHPEILGDDSVEKALNAMIHMRSVLSESEFIELLMSSAPTDRDVSKEKEVVRELSRILYKYR